MFFFKRSPRIRIFTGGTSNDIYLPGPVILEVSPNGKEADDLSWFVCVEVLWPSQPNGVMLSAVSLHNHTFTGQALSSKRFPSIVHILSPETDNCPS